MAATAGRSSAASSRSGDRAAHASNADAYDANEFWSAVNKGNRGQSVFVDNAPAAVDYETVRKVRTASDEVLLYVGFYTRKTHSIVHRSLIEGLSMMRRTTEEARDQTLADLELESTPLFECSTRKLTALEPEGAVKWPASAVTHTVRSLRSQLFKKGKKAGEVDLVPKAELAISDNGADKGRLQWTKDDSPASRMVLKTFETGGKTGQVWVAWTLASVTTLSVVELLKKCAKKWTQAHATFVKDQHHKSIVKKERQQLQGLTPSPDSYVVTEMSQYSVRALMQECILENEHLLTPVLTAEDKHREILGKLRQSSIGAVADTSAPSTARAPRRGKFWPALFGIAVAILVVVSGAIAAIVLTVTSARGASVVPAGAIALGMVAGEEQPAAIVDLARDLRGGNGHFF